MTKFKVISLFFMMLALAFAAVSCGDSGSGTPGNVTIEGSGSST
jgi:hypothetical protein